jgi:DNA-binding SARP family transcriptional activator
MNLNSESDLIKINRPLNHDTLIRDRLFRQLDSGRERSVVFISAPAGSGKTILVSSYIQEKKLPCLWYQIDGGDADPATFFHYFGLAATKVAGESGFDFPSFKPEQSYGVREFGRQFFAKIYTCLPPNSVVVLDDLQEAGDTQALEDVILSALDRIPRGVTFVMLSRSGPPSSFSRLFVSHLGSQLGWEEMRFTLDEFKAILEMRDCQMSEATADRIHRILDGWIAGLQLSMDLPWGGVPAWGGHDSPQTVFNYFSYEVFNRLDPRLQTFLTKTAFVSPLSIPMAEAISEDPKAEIFLQDLHRHNHFTYKKRQAEAVYHYHPLFREFLLQQAKERLPQKEIGRLRTTAADLLIDSQRFDEAVTCLRQAEDWDWLAAIIRRMAPALMTQGRHLTLLKWIGHLPASVSQQDPWLLFWSGVGQLYLDPNKSQTLFEKAYCGFEKKAHVTGMLQSCACLADSLTCENAALDRLDRWVRIMAEMWAQGINFENEVLEVDVIHALLSVACFRQYTHPQMPIWEQRAKAMFFQLQDADQRVKLGIRLLMVATIRGDFSGARSLIGDCDYIVRQHRGVGPLNRIRFLFNKSMYEWLAGDFSTCVQTVDEGMAFSKTSGIHIMDKFLIWNGAFAGFGMGDCVLMERYCTALADQGPLLNENEKAIAYHIESCRSQLQGETALALNAAEQSLLMAGASGFVWSEAMIKISFGQLLLQTGEQARGGRLLREALHTGEKIDSKYIVFCALIYCAAYNVTAQKGSDGDTLLRRALILGKSQGYYCLHWLAPAVVSDLLAKALTAKIEVDYVQAFVRKRTPVLRPPTLVVENWPWPLRVYTLGRFEVVIHDQTLRFSGRAQQKPLELLKALIALGGREVGASKICDALWPDADGDLQHQTFSTNLHRLRKLIGIKEALVLNNGNLNLDDRYCWVDAWAFERLLDRTDKTGATDAAPSETIRLQEKAVSFYKGRFLANGGGSWALHAQKKYRRKYLETVERLSHYYEDSGRFAEAASICQAALEIHPPVERLYQRIIRCYQQLGDRSEAVAAYMRCKAALAEAFQIQPSDRTKSLYRTVAD